MSVTITFVHDANVMTGGTDMLHQFCADPRVTSIKILDAYELQSLPPLPPRLKHLHCAFLFSLREFPALPKGLESLTINSCGPVLAYNVVPYLRIPSTVTHLHLGVMPLESLPTPLPAGLQSLEVLGTHLIALPPVLPPTLKVLECRACNFLSALPHRLPPTLKYLGIEYSSVASLPPLPPRLETLAMFGSDCARHITWIPVFPSEWGLNDKCAVQVSAIKNI